MSTVLTRVSMEYLPRLGGDGSDPSPAPSLPSDPTLYPGVTQTQGWNSGIQETFTGHHHRPLFACRPDSELDLPQGLPRHKSPRR